jgi:protein TonB
MKTTTAVGVLGVLLLAGPTSAWAQGLGKAPPAVAFSLGSKAVTQPVLVKQVKPEYPAAAKERGLHGTVTLQGTVTLLGTVDKIKVKRGIEPSLDAAAVAAFKQWTFLPGRKGDKPAPVKIDVEITFTLR